MFSNVNKATKRPSNRPLVTAFLPKWCFLSQWLQTSLRQKHCWMFVCVSDSWIQGCEASCRGWGLLKLLFIVLLFLINGAWEGSGTAVCHVLCTNALCVCMFAVCVCPLRTDPICLVDGHSLGKCVQAKNSHTTQRSNYEPPLRRRSGGVGEGIIGACPSWKGVWWFPLPSSLLHHKQIYINKKWAWKKFLWSQTPEVFKHLNVF